jgi:hypothetical protein
MRNGACSGTGVCKGGEVSAGAGRWAAGGGYEAGPESSAAALVMDLGGSSERFKAARLTFTAHLQPVSSWVESGSAAMRASGTASRPQCEAETGSAATGAGDPQFAAHTAVARGTPARAITSRTVEMQRASLIKSILNKRVGFRRRAQDSQGTKRTFAGLSVNLTVSAFTARP